MNSDLLLECTGAYDLALIEEASDLFASYIADKNNLEILLQAIISHSQKIYEVLNNETFSEELDDMDTEKEYKNSIKNYRESNEIDRFKKEEKNMISLIALQIEDVGHYAILIYNGLKKEIDLFDSMQYGTCGSHYTERFKEIASDIFQIPEENIIHMVIPMKNTPQITGGFEYFEPLYAQIENINMEKMIRIQVTESQNHYCYMWSIWYMHFRILGYDPVKILEEIRNVKLDSLFVIKRYIFQLKKILKWKIKKNAFFDKNFPRIWTNSLDPLGIERESSLFSLYELEMSDKVKTLDDALFESINYKLSVKKLPMTPIPNKIKEKCASLDMKLINYENTNETELMYFVKNYMKLGMSLKDLEMEIIKYKHQMFSSIDKEVEERTTGNNVLHVVPDVNAAKLLIQNGAKNLLYIINSYGKSPLRYITENKAKNWEEISDYYQKEIENKEKEKFY